MNNKIIKILLKECKKAVKINDVPVACVIVRNGKIVSKAHNTRNKTNFVINHAEIIAIKKASKYNHDWRLNGFDMYVTLEPCNMCKEIIKQSRIDNVFYFCASNYKQVNVYNTKYNKLSNYDEFKNILTNFFIDKR